MIGINIMARHYKKKESLFLMIIETLSEAHWSVGIGLAIVSYTMLNYVVSPETIFSSNEIINQITTTILKLLKTFSPYIAIGFLLLSVVSIFNRKKKVHLLNKQRNYATLNQLSWKEFEVLVGEAYRNKGYKVIENASGTVADGGIDLIVEKEGFTSIVQCKHWKQKIPVKTIREMYGVMVAESADEVKIITSSNFTKEAIAFAKGKPIELVTGQKLLALIGIDNIKAMESSPVEKKELLNNYCPKCEGTLIKRVAKQGKYKGNQFLGCSNYPSCRYTKNMR